jgi:hypothetical protein
MPAQDVARHEIQVVDPKSATPDEIRELAIDQIERRRRFRRRAISYATVAIVVTGIWAITEHHNAGGWPSDGFSQSSSTPHVWNIWIIYPLIGLALAAALSVGSALLRRRCTVLFPSRCSPAPAGCRRAATTPTR